MFKRVLAVASLAVLVANVGCGAAPDSSESSASDQALAQTGSEAAAKTKATLSLADAQKQVNAIRAKFNGSNDYTLLLDESLAPAYVAQIAPIFSQVAPTDKFALAESALMVISTPAASEAILTDGVLDDAVGTFADVWGFTFDYGNLQADPAFFTKLDLIIEHSSASPLADLQILSVASNLQSTDLGTALTALHWQSARIATAADAKVIPDDSAPYLALDTYLFGPVGYTVDPKLSHDLDMSSAFDVALFTQSYNELKLFTQDLNDQGGDIVDLGGHLNTVQEATGHKATHAIAIAKKVFSASEVTTLDIQLTH